MILLILTIITAVAMKVLVETEFFPAEGMEEMGMIIPAMTAAQQLPGTFADSDTFSLMIAIFASLFICTDYSSGAIKNACSRGYDRFKIYLSKLTTVWFVVAVMIISTVIVRYFSFGFLFEFGTITGAMVKELLVICGTEMLIYMALSSIFVFISTLVKNPGIAIAVNVALSMFVALILQLLDLFSKLDIDFSKYWLVNVGAEISHFDIKDGVIVRILMVTAVYFAVFLAGGLSLFQKEDIKV